MFRRQILFCVLLPLLSVLVGCEYVRPTLNAPLKQWEPTGGYRFMNLVPGGENNSDSLLILATFSGGGSRASTLAFGVLRELARQQITWEGKNKRLLDELDSISALSGGTFTAAYYALYGDQIFHDFEHRFLRKDWESELKSRILQSPSNWIRLWSPYFGRTHIMAELLDEALFEGKTYGDLLQRRQRPSLNIHATDMATLSRFEFVQTQFDWICSDLSQLPIARASAASAALPLALSPITFKNYAGTCGFEVPTEATESALKRGGAAAQRANEYLSYLDVKKRGHIHLLDGGLSDNMALRALLEASSVAGGIEKLLQYMRVKNVKKFVVLAVGAETSPDVMEFGGDQIPTLSKAMASLVDVPINRYSIDTISLMRIGVKVVREELRKRPRPADSPFTEDAEVYFINASLNEVADDDERESLMRIPTTLYLTDEQIDRLVLAAARLIRNDPDFQRLMQDLETGK
ncbi:MAG TPA: patatin-like phospholipase family protein [Nitrospiraceae bacterium]|nr:patatin-like phospholipase family protein [Nitrospiraceae bacterium]